MTRPYVLLSAAMSLDGFLDDDSPQRLLLSDAADFDRVDQVRAECDAIMVGARTLRSDNPRLLVAAESRRRARLAAGRPEYPLKVTVTASGALDPGLRVWHEGGGKLVYTTEAGARALGDSLAGLAEVRVLGPRIDLGALLDDLGARGVRRLMVEGGTSLHTALLAGDLADELRLAVAPLLVGAAGSPRFVDPAVFPARRLVLTDVDMVGDMAVLRYLLRTESIADRDRRFLRRAIALARACPPSATAFSVGAVIVADGEVLATGYSRETDEKAHAEEAALDKLDPRDPRLAGATVYSTLEPCSQRATASRLPCADRILAAGIGRVVIAWREPSTFVRNCVGVEKLRDNGVEVVEFPELAEAAMSMNRHLDLG
ncbi:MAG TPA: dihydrofolate reductase family protein [Nocardia sp.]|uniref:dihydrofolate reductase family protein n=1 Tax=Nocardia sp. TaxID=1821 RepID=UPI002B4B4956|nr:dihydrofolate reductase family protein [Nocardia sp.]HLS78557.1 dihydrofolate reductase family protein [Nocardia sp.]